MLGRLARFATAHVRELQALAALGGVALATFTFLQRAGYIDAWMKEPPRVIKCSVLNFPDADSPTCDGVEMRLAGRDGVKIPMINAPETTRAKCERERILGVRAAYYAESLKPQIKQVEWTGYYEKFTRRLVNLRMYDGKLFDDLLVENGYAIAYHPNDPPGSWCGRDPDGLDLK